MADPQAPDETKLHLQELYANSVARILLIQHQLCRVTEAFNAAGIDSSPLKGVALGQRLFGDPAMRQSGDIDILVRPEERDRALGILTQLGFTQEYAADDELDHHVTMQGHFGGTNLYLELHTAIKVNNRPHFPEEWWLHRQELAFAGRTLRIFRDDHLLVYLSLHAVHHGYIAWGWLTDIAALLQDLRCSPEAVVAASQRAGLERVVYYTLRIVRDLGGPARSHEIAANLAPNPDLYPVARFLLLRGPRNNHDLTRAILLLLTADRRRGLSLDRFIPPYRLYLNQHPDQTGAAARLRYTGWLIQRIGRAGLWALKASLSFRRI